MCQTDVYPIEHSQVTGNAVRRNIRLSDINYICGVGESGNLPIILNILGHVT